MRHNYWIKLRHLRWVILVTLGLLLIASQCSSDKKDLGSVKSQPPLNTPVELGQAVSLWVDPRNLESPVYTWRVLVQGQVKIEAQGDRSFTFTPDQSGSYEVSLEVVDGGDTFRPAPVLIYVADNSSMEVSMASASPESSASPTLVVTPSPTTMFTPSPSPTSTPSPTTVPTSTYTPTASPTVTPTLSPTPLPEAMVMTTGLNLRSGPGISYPTIGSLRAGAILNVQGRIASNEWIQVNPVYSSTLGWITTRPDYVAINVDLSTFPILTPPPPPSPTPIQVTSSVIPTITYVYTAPTLTNPDNGVGTQGTFPPLYWEWDGQLVEDEYFEVRVWFEELPYHAALAWVKQPQFDYNVSGERTGKYFWTVVIVKDKEEDVRTKDWYKPEQWPYPVYEHISDKPTDSIQILSPESEPRFFFFTVDTSGGGSTISHPPSSCGEPPC